MPGKIGFQSDSAFTRLLASKGIHAARELGALAGVANRLVHTPEKVAPNSPLLEPLAGLLNVSVQQVRKFARGEPMSGQFERKVRIQMERGTLNKGGARPEAKRRAAKQSVGKNSKPFFKFVMERGFNLKELARRTNLPDSFLWRMSAGEIAPNHPGYEAVASVVGCEPSDLTQFVKPEFQKPLEGGHLKRAHTLIERYQKGLRAKQPGTALVRRRAHAVAKTNGEGLEDRGRQNRLGSKRTEAELQRSARIVFATLNVSILNGDTHIPPLEVGHIYRVLQDYASEKGIKKVTLLDPSFAKLFGSR